jgi:hypothetical protein
VNDELKCWAIVEVMGHNEYAGFITAETIAGAPMLRVDVPEVLATAAYQKRDAFTKFLAPSALYAISPCTEHTARLRAAALRKTPFESWSVEKQVVERLRDEGKLVSERQLSHAEVSADGDDSDSRETYEDQDEEE